MKYKTVIFDLDGTTLNTLTDLTQSVNYVMNLHGFPTRTEKEVRNFLGNGIRRLVELSAPKNTSAATVETLYSEFLPYYKLHSLNNTKPYDGMKEVLLTLKNEGYLLGLVSNKADVVVKDLVHRFFDGIFDYSVGQLEGVERKPSPDTVNVLLRKFGVSSSDAVYVGDSEVDYQTGRNANMDVMLVTYGYRDKEFLQTLGAEYLVDTVDEIADILK